MTACTILLPIRVVSEANVRGHWAAKAKRVREHRGVARMLVLARRVRGDIGSPPYLVKLTKVGGRAFDTDNLSSAFKATRDGIAEALGIDDGDVERLRFVYDQIGEPKVHRVIVRIEGS
jgi:crossover junction endodeoxyribonuclease RusA